MHQYLLLLRIHTGDFRQHDRCIGLFPENPANRRGDVRGRQPRCGNLIEEWLKEMMVVAINDRDLYGRFAQGMSRLYPAKSPADNHHPRLDCGQLEFFRFQKALSNMLLAECCGCFYLITHTADTTSHNDLYYNHIA